MQTADSWWRFSGGAWNLFHNFVILLSLKCGPLAQLVEQRPFKAWVEGSNPSRLTIYYRVKGSKEKGIGNSLELGYRKNIAWQKNQQAIIQTAKLIEEFPETAPFKKIAGQLFSSVSSTGTNIAEGYSDFEGKEYQRYLKILLRSAFETDHWLASVQSLVNGTNKKHLQLIEEINSLNSEMIKILFKTIESIKKKRRGER